MDQKETFPKYWARCITDLFEIMQKNLFLGIMILAMLFGFIIIFLVKEPIFFKLITIFNSSKNESSFSKNPVEIGTLVHDKTNSKNKDTLIYSNPRQDGKAP